MTEELAIKIIKKGATYESSECQQAFNDGVDLVLNNLWHDGMTEPKYGSMILVRYPSGEIAYGKYIGNFDYDVCHSGHVEGLERSDEWCYTDDLKPAGKATVK